MPTEKAFLFIKRAVYFQKLTAGGDAELAVKVFVVEFKGVFLDVKLFQDLFSVLAADVGVKDEPLGGGKGAKAAGEIFEGLGGDLGSLCALFRLQGLLFFDQAAEPLIFACHHMNSKEEKLAYNIGDREHFEGHIRKLLNKPDPDVDKYRGSQNHGVVGGFEGLFYKCADYYRYHGGKITYQKDEIQGVKGSVDLYKGRNTVHYRKGDLFIIYIEDAGACGHKKDESREEEEGQRELFYGFRARDLQNYHQH